MKEFERGPLKHYRICRHNGKIEDVMAHQLITPQGYDGQYVFHGEYDGKWELALSVSPREVKEVRNLSVEAFSTPLGANIVERFRDMRSKWRLGVKQ